MPQFWYRRRWFQAVLTRLFTAGLNEFPSEDTVSFHVTGNLVSLRGTRGKKELVELYPGWGEMLRTRYEVTSMKGSDMRDFKEQLQKIFKKSTMKKAKKNLVSQSTCCKVFDFAKDRKFDVIFTRVRKQTKSCFLVQVLKICQLKMPLRNRILMRRKFRFYCGRNRKRRFQMLKNLLSLWHIFLVHFDEVPQRLSWVHPMNAMRGENCRGEFHSQASARAEKVSRPVSEIL